MYERLILLYELLSEKGSIYLHCDWHKSHHIRFLLDEVFGEGNFVNEVVWNYYNKMPTGGNVLDRQHDTILQYKKHQNFICNRIEEAKNNVKTTALRKKVNGREEKMRDEEGNVIYQVFENKKASDVCGEYHLVEKLNILRESPKPCWNEL